MKVIVELNIKDGLHTGAIDDILHDISLIEPVVFPGGAILVKDKECEVSKQMYEALKDVDPCGGCGKLDEGCTCSLKRIRIQQRNQSIRIQGEKG